MTETPASTGDQARLLVWAATHVGRVRAENQDAFLVLGASPGSNGTSVHLSGDDDFVSGGAGRPLSTEQPGTFLVVCDGMGGPKGGGRASRLAVAGIRGVLEQGPGEGEKVAELVRRAVERGNLLVHQESLLDESFHGMGTTATVAAVLGHDLYLGHVGDSRAYLVRSGRARQLTRDQTVAQELLDQGALGPEEARRTPHRHILTQALGTAREVRVAPGRRALLAGDWIVLCSDGLSELVDPDELAEAVGDRCTPEEAGRELVAMALDRGAPDNVTVILARFTDSEDAS